MKIAILGGAFNPPHLGHQLIAKQILDFTDTQEVWLTPCYKHTFQKHLAPTLDRITMTQMLTYPKIKYCSEEIDNQLSGETIELMSLITKKYPQHDFSFIIGSDNLATFKKWGQWERLIVAYKFLIFPRTDLEIRLAQYGLDKAGYLFTLVEHPLLITSNISSTKIRERLKQGLDIDSLVLPKVQEYIAEHKLYATD
jgi:nicotinate-nucleotide adenylyltransferase